MCYHSPAKNRGNKCTKMLILICVTGINNFSSRKNAGDLKYRWKSLLVECIRRFFSLCPALRSLDFDEGARNKVDQNFKVPAHEHTGWSYKKRLLTFGHSTGSLGPRVVQKVKVVLASWRVGESHVRRHSGHRAGHHGQRRQQPHGLQHTEQKTAFSTIINRYILLPPPKWLNMHAIRNMLLMSCSGIYNLLLSRAHSRQVAHIMKIIYAHWEALEKVEF